MLPPLRKKPRKAIRKKIVKDIEPLWSPAHTAFVKRYQCSIPNCEYAGFLKIDAHHVKTRGSGGGDEWLVSLCRQHHHQFHTIGRHSFDEKHGVNMRQIAREFAAASPDPKVRAASREMEI